MGTLRTLTGCLVSLDTGDVIDAGIIVLDPTVGVTVIHDEGISLIYTPEAYPEVGVIPVPEFSLN